MSITIKQHHIEEAFKRFLPQAKAAPKRETARMENLEEGVCPYCHQAMTTTTAAGVPVWVCFSDRAVSPKLNSAEPDMDVTVDLAPTI